MTIYYVALGIGILAGIGGQMLLKAGADAPDFVSQLMRPSTIAGLALYGSAAFLYIIALRKIPVSVAFPSVSLSYALVAVLGLEWERAGDRIVAALDAAVQNVDRP